MDIPQVSLTNNLSTQPYNSNVAWNNSWVGVTGANYPLFARASYITNFDDLTISLSADHVTIGDFNIADPVTKINANVVILPDGSGALKVLSQDLDAVHDSVSIGDINGNYALISNSALRVYQTNPVTSLSAFVTNPVTSLSATITNTLSVLPHNVTVTNQLTAITINQEPSLIRTFNNFNNSGPFTVGGTEVPVLAVRIKPNSGSTGYIEGYDLVSSAGNGQNTTILGYTWYYQPSAIGGAYTWNNLVSSNLQYASLSGNTFSGGIPIHSGAIISANPSNEYDIGFTSLSGSPTPDVLLLSMKRLDSSSSTTFWYAVDFAQN